jgi:NAD(P)H-hydrate epimerase
MESPILVQAIPRLPARADDSHKGTFGKVLVIAGSVGMSGAAVLTGTAALRSGAGLVQLVVPAAIGPIVATGQICCTTTWMPSDAEGKLSQAGLSRILETIHSANAIVMGPGLGQSDDVRTLVRTLIAVVKQPLVLDADALNVLGGEPPEFAKRTAPLIVTPHPGEFGRMINVDTPTVQANRESLAFAFAQRHNCILVLKGAGTIVTDGTHLYINTTGNPGMATGGSGDVLAGVIGALLAQGMPAYDAAVLGVYMHGRAGDLARERVGEVALIATDVIEHLGGAFLSV